MRHQRGHEESLERGLVLHQQHRAGELVGRQVFHAGHAGLDAQQHARATDGPAEPLLGHPVQRNAALPERADAHDDAPGHHGDKHPQGVENGTDKRHQTATCSAARASRASKKSTKAARSSCTLVSAGYSGGSG
ncbi:hypothetical protein D9M69_645040 [compost metagenome]